ncbi:MAG TPA: hypothetical protein VFT55_14165 [Planctomycetota bacterium]|nr:hypothetical protein [Planctomycetota bacterium]
MLVRSLAVALLAAPVVSQIGAVPGLDISLYDVAGFGYYGHRGAAWPNGEAGFMVGHSHANCGTVNLPWVSTGPGGVMLDTYPKIAFLLARESNGRMVQVSGKSFLKHSPTPYNFSSGPCTPCTGSFGAFFYTGCSDTYGSGINSYQLALGPTTEINPWLGTWNPQGSYFDTGDPSVGGAAAVDSIRSLTTTQIFAFDDVKNRMVVRDSEIVAGALYYGQAQVVALGEPVANRGNNLSSRQVTLSWNGSGYATNTTGGSTFGSVLTRWQGAVTDLGGNGNDDGRFLVAVKVTGPVAGLWHYEYAVHNLDNHRGGASLRVPVDAAATVQNPGFRDIDADPLNDWTYARTATEISFSASAANPLDWNTIYNFWFDCSVAPSLGFVDIDEARLGPGLLTVQVGSMVPSGVPVATAQSIGASCGNCASAVYESFATPALFDLNTRSMTLALNNGTYTVAETPVAYIAPTGTSLGLSDDSETTVALPFSMPYPGGSTTQLRVCSNGFISPAGSNGTSYTPQVGAFLGGQPRWAAAWHDFTPSLAAPVVLDASAAMVRVTWLNVPNYGGGGSNTFQYQFLPNGTVHVIWQSMQPAGNSYLVGWSPGLVQQDPGGRDLSATLANPYTLCTSIFSGLTLGVSARPILGTTFQWHTTGIPTGTGFGALLRSLTRATPPIDLTPIGMPGCAAHVVDPVATLYLSPSSSVQLPESIPNVASLIGVVLVGQALTYSPPLTPIGLVASNGMVLTLGM